MLENKKESKSKILDLKSGGMDNYSKEDLEFLKTAGEIAREFKEKYNQESISQKEAKVNSIVKK